MTAPSPTRRIASLDGLRCLAIVPVVWHHATPRPYEGVLGRGPLGVDLFFVISGFLITTLLLGEVERTGGLSLTAFYVRRSLRIFPLYYAVLGAFVVHALVFREHGPVRDHFLRTVPTYATYTSNWFANLDVPHPVVFSFAWSLATEEQFYLVWPWVIWAAAALHGRGATRSLLTLPALFMALLLLADQAVERGWMLGSMAQGALAPRMVRSISTPICLGSLLALGARSRRTLPTIQATLAHPASAPAALVAVILAAMFAWPLLVAHLAMTALVGACVLAPAHGLRWLLEKSPVTHVGLVSYGVYLLNVPVVVAVRRALGPASESTVLVFGAALAGSVALATITRRYIELPFLRLRERRPKPGAHSK